MCFTPNLDVNYRFTSGNYWLYNIDPPITSPSGMVLDQRLLPDMDKAIEMPTCDAASEIDAATLDSQSDFQIVAPGQQVTVQITVRNTGTTTWNGSTYRWSGRGAWEGQSDVLGVSVAPGATLVVRDITFSAPAQPGQYDYGFMLLNADGAEFGPYFFVRITVTNPKTYSISGKITNSASGLPMPNVVVKTNTGFQAVTNFNGEYLLNGLPAGLHTVTPQSPAGFTISPPSRTIQITVDYWTNQNFSAIPASGRCPVFNVAFNLTTSTPDVLVELTGSDGDRRSQTFADTFNGGSGIRLDNLHADVDYSVTISKAGWMFGFNDMNPFTIRASSDRAGPCATRIFYTVTANPNRETRAWTIMVYLAGDNDLELAERKQVSALIEAGRKNANVYVAIFWDGNVGTGFVPAQSAYFHSANDGGLLSPILKGELNSGDPKTLSDFTQWARNSFPANHYALVISDHGNGVTGIAKDLHPDDILKLPEISQALGSQPKLDVIYMHACNMATIESGYQLRNTAQYYVASEWPMLSGDNLADFVLGTGDVPAILSTTTAAELSRSMAKSYADFSRNNKMPVHISVARLDYASSVITQISALANGMRNQMSALKDTIQNSIVPNLLYVESNGDSMPDSADEYVDLYHFAERVQANISNAQINQSARNLMGAIQTYIVFEDKESGFRNTYRFPLIARWDAGNSHGVSVFFPQRSRSFYKTGYLEFCDDTVWNLKTTEAASDQAMDATIGWGPMVVEYIRETNPNTPDDPNPPFPLAPLDLPRVHLPLVVNR